MSKYSVGDKFVVEIEEMFTSDICNLTPMLYRIKGFNSLMFDKNGLDKLERLDGDYVNEHFGELHDEAFGEGRNCGIAEALKWNKGNEEDFYNKGLNDAWELAKKICLNSTEGGMIENVLRVFGKCSYDVLAEMTPQEALDKIEAYEKEQEEIKVWDVVESGNTKGIALRVYQWNDYTKINVLMQNGAIETAEYAYDWKKTGKHIDISAILAEIGKE